MSGIYFYENIIHVLNHKLSALIASISLAMADQKRNSNITLHQYLPFWPKETEVFHGRHK